MALTTAAASASLRLTSFWNCFAAAREASSRLATAPLLASTVLSKLDALSFIASVTCASLTRKMRFHGNRNLACCSPNVRVLMYTSFWNSLLDSISASLSPSSILLRNNRRPTSMCAFAASASSKPNCARKFLSASGSQPCTGSSPMGITDMRYASYNSVTPSGQSLAMSFMPNLLPMASTSAFVMEAGSRFIMPFQSALGAADTRFLSAVTTPAAAAAPSPTASAARPALPPTLPPTVAPIAKPPPTTAAYAANRAPPRFSCCCSKPSISFSNAYGDGRLSSAAAVVTLRVGFEATRANALRAGTRTPPLRNGETRPAFAVGAPTAETDIESGP
mmetsp:Transcript_11978/g.44556  ORF Transcript_11978/g.44556 Transcript_11978/m.44556 type:complete len:335 (+) Transcript_11978:4128-5132(+)